MNTDHPGAKEELYAQESEFKILKILLPYIKNKTFIDVGAEKGSFARQLMEFGFTGTLFEPCPKHHPELMRLTENSGSLFFDFAIDKKDREASLHIAVDENGEPMDYYHSLHYLSDDSRVNHQKEIPVNCRSLESLLNEGIIGNDIGILKMDTEGNDLQVIQGMAGVLPEVLICEFFTQGLYAGWSAAAPEGLIAEVKNALGYDHYMAIKRLADFELISFGPAVFLEKQWGNLIFINNELYHGAFKELQQAVISSEKQIFEMAGKKDAQIRAVESQTEKQLTEKIDALYRVCEQRLELINHLTEEAEKRGEIIQQLDNKLRNSE
ncbi:MAG: FkbM family methyltransferase [Desulfobacteraceae bacterium]|nr:FkbM family methyltransferase [Desulfobacteraceae bacterium]MBC2754908.1 FkbM family methyltransferase [Desulfobacteraceae bacterium]